MLPRCFSEDPLTLCQKQNQKPPSPSGLMPNCKRDGFFEEVQCTRSTGECWCVDSQGSKILGTTTSGYLRCPSESELIASEKSPIEHKHDFSLRFKVTFYVLAVLIKCGKTFCDGCFEHFLCYHVMDPSFSQRHINSLFQ